MDEGLKLKNEELNRKSVTEFKNSDKTRISIILDNVRSMNNVGSIFRTADAFLIEKIYLCGITARPPHRDIQKTALGATETVEWEYIENSLVLINDLISKGIFIGSVEQTKNSVSLGNFKIPLDKKIALVFGNEVDGVNEEVVRLSHECIEIPQIGFKHSLNISVSVGIVVWELFNQLNKIPHRR